MNLMNLGPAAALAVLAGLSTAPAARAQLVDEGLPAGTTHCAGVGVNDTGQVVGGCLETEGSSSPFGALANGTEFELSRLVATGSCAAAAITNAGRVIGACEDSASVGQAVVWPALSPTAVLQQLQPLPGGVSTAATGFNQDGAVAGVSLDGTGTGSPALWKAGATAATVLPVGLLGLGSTNCAPSDVADGSGTAPTVLGNCPDGQGRARPLFWTPTGLLGAYVANVLAVPTGAASCAAGLLVNGRALGVCDFGPTNGERTVVWTAANTWVVLTVTDATGQLRNSGTDINSAGEVVGGITTRDGHALPYHWNVVTDAFTVIPALPGGANASVAGIGENGVVAGTGETSAGTDHAIAWTAASGTVDLGTLPGGSDSGVASLSRSGCFITGSSEIAAHDVRAYVDNLCSAALKAGAAQAAAGQAAAIQAATTTSAQGASRKGTIR